MKPKEDGGQWADAATHAQLSWKMVSPFWMGSWYADYATTDVGSIARETRSSEEETVKSGQKTTRYVSEW